VILISFPLLAVKARQQEKIIADIELANELTQQQIDEYIPYVKMVDELYAQIQSYASNLALNDTLATRQTDWSRRLREWTAAFDETGLLWLDRFSTTKGDIDIKGNWEEMDLSAPSEVYLFGKAIAPAQAAEIAALLGEVQIHSLTRTPIREQTVFQFYLTVPVPPDGAGPAEP